MRTALTDPAAEGGRRGIEEGGIAPQQSPRVARGTDGKWDGQGNDCSTCILKSVIERSAPPHGRKKFSEHSTLSWCSYKQTSRPSMPVYGLQLMSPPLKNA